MSRKRLWRSCGVARSAWTQTEPTQCLPYFDDWNAFELLQRQQIVVTGDNRVGRRGNGTREHMDIIRIA